jgi:L-ascorbate metabolism protein UlaG (beta-lactamase superfamily)
MLLDPWLTGNPMFPEGRRAEAIAGVTHILITHGHGDHAGDAVAIAAETGAVIVGQYDLMSHWAATEGATVIGFNKGGTVQLGDVAVTMVNAVHSSSLPGMVYAGVECGYMIAGEGHVIHASGDTDIMADMEWMGEYHQPDIAIWNCGGHFTMDMGRAAWAAKKWFDFKVMIPAHYLTFGLLAQDASELVKGLPGVDVKTPAVMEALEI